MKLVLVFCLALIISESKGQKNKLRTENFAGTYNRELGAILIYPETDSTVLFYIDVNRGAPSYNMGALFGRMKVINESGVFESNIFKSSDKGCKWKILFSKKELTIMTVEEAYNCGFGNGVVADGTFKRASNKVPEYFESSEGIKTLFKDSSPEKYDKN
jgi:hypothetical protein